MVGYDPSQYIASHTDKRSFYSDDKQRTFLLLFPSSLFPSSPLPHLPLQVLRIQAKKVKSERLPLVDPSSFADGGPGGAGGEGGGKSRGREATMDDSLLFSPKTSHELRRQYLQKLNIMNKRSRASRG